MCDSTTREHVHIVLTPDVLRRLAFVTLRQPTAAAMFRFLLSQMDTRNEAHASDRTLARELGCDCAAVRRSFAELTRRHWITRAGPACFIVNRTIARRKASPPAPCH